MEFNYCGYPPISDSMTLYLLVGNYELAAGVGETRELDKLQISISILRGRERNEEGIF